VEVLTVLQGDLGVVRDDFVFPWPLQEENITQGDASQVLQVLARLDMVFQLVPLLVYEDVYGMAFGVMMLVVVVFVMLIFRVHGTAPMFGYVRRNIR
jgi:hypothetical protein